MLQKNKLVKNLFSLSIAEIATKGVAFFITFYLARVFNVEGYGIVTKITTIVAYLTMVNLGFNMVGLRAISRNIEEKEKYVNNILTLKIVLSLILFSLVCIYIFFFSQANFLVKIAFLLGSLQIFTTSIQIDWFYQSIERMEILGLRQFLVSVITLIGVFLFVKTAEDIPIYMAIVSCSLLLNNSWLLLLYRKSYAKLRLTFNFAFWKELLKSSLPITSSIINTTLVNSFNIIYLSLTVNDYRLGLFSAAFKLYAFCMIPASIVQNSFLPTIARATTVSEKQDAMQKYSKLLALTVSILAVIVIFFADFFINLVFGNNFSGSVNLLRLLMIALFFSFYNTSIMPSMLAWEKEKNIMYIFTVAAIVNILLNIILVNNYWEIGSTFATIGTEITLSILLSILLIREIGKNYIRTFAKFIVIAIISVSIAYLLSHLNLIFKIEYFATISQTILSILGIILSFIIFLFLVFKLNYINFQEIKRSIKR